MRSKLFWAGVFVCLATASIFAQDPTKVEPKHYRLDFENERVQVVSVYYGPHEKSVLHEHPGGVVVSLTEAHLRFTDENGKTREVFSKPGEARWYPPFKHRVENLGDTTYRAVYVGVKGKVEASGGFAHPTDASDTGALDKETAEIVAHYLLTLGKP
jgi:quercetin dioxygenase-like cupin family protein